MVIVDVVVAASAALALGVIIVTAKFSREMPIHKNFNELWFENQGKSQRSVANVISTVQEEADHHSSLIRVI